MTNTPSLKIYHAQSDRNGTALKMALSPAVYISEGETLEGFIELTMARQLGKPSPYDCVNPNWDWNAATPIRLTFTNLSELLLVLDGQRNALNDGEGLTFDGPNGEKLLLTAFVSGAQPTDGGNVRLTLRTDKPDGNWTQTTILLHRAEVVGLACSLKAALFYVAFGDPNA